MELVAASSYVPGNTATDPWAVQAVVEASGTEGTLSANRSVGPGTCQLGKTEMEGTGRRPIGLAKQRQKKVYNIKRFMRPAMLGCLARSGG